MQSSGKSPILKLGVCKVIRYHVLGLDTLNPGSGKTSGSRFDRKELAMKIFIFTLSIIVSITTAHFAGCDRNGENNVVDSGIQHDADVPDSRVEDAGTGEIMADMVVSGCEYWETDDSTNACVGTAPFSLDFSPLTSKGVESYQWRFGDNTEPVFTQIAAHTYQTPGVYDVTLFIEGSFGILEVKKVGLVRVKHALLGGFCEEDENCLTEHCHCNESEDIEICPADMTGFCASSCLETPCDEGICVDLSTAGLEDSPDPDEWTWRQPLCMPPCETDEDCSRPGTSCLSVPVFDSENLSTQWTSACMPPVLGQTGDPCRNWLGEYDDELCLGGLCLPVAAGGMCSRGCEIGTCPPHAGCVRFHGTDENVCLPSCREDAHCGPDPLLGCETGDGTGFYDFSPVGEPMIPPEEFCAPRRCEQDHECSWGGYCDIDLGGFCISIE